MDRPTCFIKRAVAFMIDLALLAIPCITIYIALFIILKDSGALDRLSEYGRAAFFIVVAGSYQLIRFLLQLFKDAEGAGVGKRLMKLKLTREGDDTAAIPPSYRIARNLTFIIWPIEVISILATGSRLSDRLLGLKVVSTEPEPEESDRESNPQAEVAAITANAEKPAKATDSLYYKRFMAFLIDLAIFCGAAALIASILTGCGSTHGAGVFTVSDAVSTFAWTCFFCRDLIGIGKRVMGLSVVSVYDGSDANALQLIVRNITFIIWPLEIFVLLNSHGAQRLGDRMMNIAVVRDDSRGAHDERKRRRLKIFCMADMLFLSLLTALAFLMQR